MTIYFLRAGSDGPVKIGLAENVRERVAGLQTGAAAELTVIREVAGGKTVEAWLHRKFRDLRIRGEWFDYCDDMLTVPVPAAMQADDDADEHDTASATNDALDHLRSTLRDLLADKYLPESEAIKMVMRQRARECVERAVWGANLAVTLGEACADSDPALAKECTVLCRAFFELHAHWESEAERFAGPPSRLENIEEGYQKFMHSAAGERWLKRMRSRRGAGRQDATEAAAVGPHKTGAGAPGL